jgi:hypothetical protein
MMRGGVESQRASVAALATDFVFAWPADGRIQQALSSEIYGKFKVGDV